MAIVPGSIQVLTKSVAWYTLNDPLLLLGQWGIESDDLLTVPKYKIGDGVTLWSALPYANNGTGTTPGLPAVLTVDPNTTGNDIIVTNGDKVRFDISVSDYYFHVSAGYFILRNNSLLVDVFTLAGSAFGFDATMQVSMADLVVTNSASFYNGLDVGVSSTFDGSIIFKNAVNANTLTLKSGTTVPTFPNTDITYIFPITDPTAGQVLSASLPIAGVSTLSWATVATSVSLTVGTTPITSGTASRILFEGAGNVVSESANLVWDNTNNQLSLLGAGTAALPTIGIGAADLGFFSPAANELAVTTGGSERFRFSSTYFRSPTTGGPNLRRAAGAVATPTYAFNGAVTTGMWLNGTFLDFSVGGVAAGGFSGSGVFKLYNAGGTFGYNITASNLAADRTLNIPLLTATDTFAMVDFAQTLTNKTMTGATNILTASLLKSATTEVDVSAATAPSNGQVLTATSSTTATWQTPSGGGLSIGLSYSIARGYAMA